MRIANRSHMQHGFAVIICISCTTYIPIFDALFLHFIYTLLDALSMMIYTLTLYTENISSYVSLRRCFYPILDDFTPYFRQLTPDTTNDLTLYTIYSKLP